MLKEFYTLFYEAEDGGLDMKMLMNKTENYLHLIATTDLSTMAVCEWIGKQARHTISQALAHYVSVHYLQNNISKNSY
ncbi:hypothetical protein PSCICN_45740 [Pseudomonas cichorii]|uniref:hypothetical protein n=1 Tax=Pseudomonas cichorii TaxID=36746 RepID=UPI00191082B0|nr:hypothetical protein [Pseudomonas cichorii]GFM83882.1 hypothetical protein PSCICN_45740 [Pseudomonas cichorii]